MQPVFSTDYSSVLAKLDTINPSVYAKTRNYIDGSVTYVSPYISRGVITLPQVVKAVLAKGYKPYQLEKFLQELAWREFFQRTWWHYGDDLFTDIKRPQQDVLHHQMIKAVDDATTGIDAVDKLIENLYETGYMHNHARMYTAGITCNIGKAHWWQPSRWLYYHLFDGDLASNTLNWQWVAGSFSAKKYIANQENVSRYLKSNQQKSFLNESYQTIFDQPVPDALKETIDLQLTTLLPETDASFSIDNDKPLHIYTTYWLNPEWRKEEEANRIFLLEPSHFEKFPISEKVLNFCVTLAKENIPVIQVFVGEFDELQKQYSGENIISLEHPLHNHFSGTKDPYPWMFPQVKEYAQSFFAFWKKCEKHLTALTTPI